jgi:hypothetical protein
MSAALAYRKLHPSRDGMGNSKLSQSSIAKNLSSEIIENYNPR